MRLAKKFTFVHASVSGPLYTAEETDTGDYTISWDEYTDQFGYRGDAGSTEYERSPVSRNIVDGTWRVREVLEVEKEEPSLPDVLNVITAGTATKYTVIRQDSGNFYLFSEQGDRVGTNSTYTEDLVRGFIEDGMWIVKDVTEEEELPSLEVGDDIVAASWPFRTDGWTLTDGAELLPPDDIAELVTDYGVSLTDVRKFCEDTGYTVEVDEDHTAFVYDGQVEYVVSDDGDMAAVMQAIRTLTKFSDRG